MRQSVHYFCYTLYRNLLSLKHYDGDLCELGLDFTVANKDLGEAQVVEQKPVGRDLAVDNTNRIEYIYLMADFRLNRQVRYTVRNGLSPLSLHCQLWTRGKDPHLTFPKSIG